VNEHTEELGGGTDGCGLDSRTWRACRPFTSAARPGLWNHGHSGFGTPFRVSGSPRVDEIGGLLRLQAGRTEPGSHAAAGARFVRWLGGVFELGIGQRGFSGCSTRRGPVVAVRNMIFNAVGFGESEVLPERFVRGGARVADEPLHRGKRRGGLRVHRPIGLSGGTGFGYCSGQRSSFRCLFEWSSGIGRARGSSGFEDLRVRIHWHP